MGELLEWLHVNSTRLVGENWEYWVPEVHSQKQIEKLTPVKREEQKKD